MTLHDLSVLLFEIALGVCFGLLLVIAFWALVAHEFNKDERM